MFERFTDRARKVVYLADQEARRFGHEYIGTEHVLLGFVKEGSGIGAQALLNLDIDLRKVRLEVEKCMKSGSEVLSRGKLRYTPRTQKAFEFAKEEACGIDHNYIGTEHLLLGLFREGEGVAAQVLIHVLGLTLEKVREEIIKLTIQEIQGLLTQDTKTSQVSSDVDEELSIHRVCLHCDYGQEDKAIEEWRAVAPQGLKIVFTELVRTVPPKHLFTGPESVDVFIVIWYTKSTKVF